MPSPLGFIFYHLAPYTVSPTDLVVRCSTWEGEGHKTNTHAYVTRTVCVDHIRKNTVTRKIVQLGVTVVFANGIYTPSARDARVRLGLAALRFQVDCLAIRSVGDRVYGARCLPLLFQGDSIRQFSIPVIQDFSVIGPKRYRKLGVLPVLTENRANRWAAGQPIDWLYLRRKRVKRLVFYIFLVRGSEANLGVRGWLGLMGLSCLTVLRWDSNPGHRNLKRFFNRIFKGHGRNEHQFS